MKKFLCLLMCLIITGVICAQKVSGNEIIDRMLKAADEAKVQGERLFEEVGVKSEIDIYFDQKNNELVYSYRFFSEQVFEGFDLNAAKKGSIQGMISEVLNADKSGDALEWIVGEFKRTKTDVRMKVIYKKQVKSILATSMEIQRLASLLY